MHFTFAIALYIPNYNLQHSIINTMKIQNDTWLNESITIEPTEISTEFSESNISTVIIDPTTWLPTDSTEKPTTNLWSNLKQHLPALIGIVGGICLCVILSVCICCYCRRRGRRPKRPRPPYRKYSVLTKANTYVTILLARYSFISIEYKIIVLFNFE
ncbi:unnamed protein product [Adineta steineri]|uniref:Uncharacterized protein n=1 Tax=Adineta steineri TaxID=433720 RepID=A0A819ZAN2_9BILA|nr:unnamed protein product [Adineta steineri]